MIVNGSAHDPRNQNTYLPQNPLPVCRRRNINECTATLVRRGAKHETLIIVQHRERVRFLCPSRANDESEEFFVFEVARQGRDLEAYFPETEHCEDEVHDDQWRSC